MAILPIARMGQYVLRRRAEEVADPAAPEIRTLIADMVETVQAVNGAGLAAPQVFVPKRVVIFTVPPGRSTSDEFDQPLPLTAIVNPVIEPLTEETEVGWEGCLSIPGMRGAVPRIRKLRYRGVGPEGEVIDRIATGWHARVVQHEFDHLDGILYPMRMTDLGLFGYVEELEASARSVAEAEAIAAED
jgi:peptide deformylase